MTGRSNPFDAGRAAALSYASARPYYHPLAIRLAMQSIGEQEFQAGLDIGCGTGLSTRALREHARRVVAVDASAGMLAVAAPLPSVVYVRGRAERLPVRTGSVEIVTCGAAMHWFAGPAFAELARVTRPRAWAVVYTDFFTGEVVGQPQFAAWFRQTYLQRLPSPPRGHHYDEQALSGNGFHLVAQEQRRNELRLRPTQLAGYLMTQSNARVAVARGTAGAVALHDWVESELADLLGDALVQAVFGYRVWTAQKRER